MHPVRLGLLFVALLGVIGAAPGSPRTFVVLPVEGPVLPSVRSAVDESLRGALLPYGDVQTRADTSLILDDAAKGGLACALDNVECIVRVGTIAGASHVLQTTLKSGKALSAEVVLVDVDVGRATTVRGPFILGDGGRSARALVTRALSGKSDPPPVPPSTSTSTAEPLPTSPTPPGDATPSPLFIGAAVTTVAGGLLAVGAAIGLAVVEAELGTPKADESAADVDSQRSLGMTLLGASVLGVVAAGAGGALVATELSP